MELAIEASAALEAQNIATRVVSMPCVELFKSQDADYQKEVLPTAIPKVSIEAGITFGWGDIVGSNGASVGIDRFGASAPGAIVADKLGMNVDTVVSAAKKVL